MANQTKEETRQNQANDQEDRRHQDNGQGEVGLGGHDKQGHPLTKDGHVDHRVKAARDGEADDNNQDNDNEPKRTKDGHIDHRTKEGRAEKDN